MDVYFNLPISKIIIIHNTVTCSGRYATLPKCSAATATENVAAVTCSALLPTSGASFGLLLTKCLIIFLSNKIKSSKRK